MKRTLSFVLVINEKEKWPSGQKKLIQKLNENKKNIKILLQNNVGC